MAAAAYRSGERLYDSSQGKWFEFDKPDVVHTEILAPANIPVPEWVFDRQTLWNMVERSEKRKDAQLAREVEITLPRELSRDQQIALVRAFVREKFVSQGMVADFAIHNPSASDGEDQPHTHVLLTLRRLDGTTGTGFAATKERSSNERDEVAQAFAEARKRRCLREKKVLACGHPRGRRPMGASSRKTAAGGSHRSSTRLFPSAAFAFLPNKSASGASAEPQSAKAPAGAATLAAFLPLSFRLN